MDNRQKKIQVNPQCPKLHPIAFLRKESTRDPATGAQGLFIRKWCSKCEEEEAGEE